MKKEQCTYEVQINFGGKWQTCHKYMLKALNNTPREQRETALLNARTMAHRYPQHAVRIVKVK